MKSQRARGRFERWKRSIGRRKESGAVTFAKLQASCGDFEAR